MSNIFLEKTVKNALSVGYLINVKQIDSFIARQDTARLKSPINRFVTRIISIIKSKKTRENFYDSAGTKKADKDNCQPFIEGLIARRT
jgi:hypothetical protein